MWRWHRIGPKLLVAGGVLQGVLPRVDGQLDVLGKAGVTGWLPVLALVALGLAWEVHQRRSSTVDVGDDGRVRRALLESVRAQWVTGVLDRSLEAVARVEVGLTRRPEAVDHPWGTLVAPDRRPVSSLAEVHDRGGLLLLGEPGAGKTTALLELARDLLDRAVADPEEPVPAVFHLSSWAARHASLAEWLVDELVKRYGVPRGVAREWVRTDAVLPLLDGLDEVDPAWREDCVAAINAWRTEHGLSGVVVCARTGDHARLRTRLSLGAAVVLEPLGRKEVAAYLREAGRPLAGLRTALRQDPRLLDLLTTPLMLSVCVLAYAGAPADRVRADPLGDYVAAMLARPRSGLAARRFTPAQTRRYLSWLARAMDRHHESVFYPDWVRLSWLPTRALRVRALVGTALVVAVGTVVVLSLVSYSVTLVLIRPTVMATWEYPAVWSVPGTITGLVACRRRIAPVNRLRWRTVVPALRRLAVGGAVGVTATMVLHGLTTLNREPSNRFLEGVPDFLGLAVAGWVAAAATALFRRRTSWSVVRATGTAGAAGAAVTAVLCTYLVGWPLTLVALVTSAGLVGWALAHTRPRPDLTPSAPGAAITTTRDQALVAGAAVALAGALAWSAVVVTGYLSGPHFQPMTSVLVFGVWAGVLTAVVLGVGDWLRHRAVLRLLARRGYLPRDLLGFLDHADSHILLRCTGPGYAFVHRMVLDHFAGKGPGGPETLPAPRLSPGPAPGGAPRPRPRRPRPAHPSGGP
ncbi:NACHT domain-containing protein [Saccharothrix variisporea]|uniref:NACHT domain-containing protein n=1 Tax=Saccharothrix variisporea TaxID=543527 RepID=A0A495XGF7_9PSEU|nr:NACHT domain-containing protein [Saccharothrix variisporea]RKT73117.1 NACHT domain-containing protein [Saccharothrix variisporea]